MLVSVLVAAGVGVGLAVLTAWVLFKANVKVNVVQRQLNKVENKLAAVGANWMSELFADVVVGDVKSVELRLRQFIEAEDSTLFFLDNVAMPLALYAVRETKENYPEKFAVLKKEVNGVVVQQ